MTGSPLPSRAALEAALETDFRLTRLDGGPGSLDLRLIEVAVRKSQPGYEQLSLLFIGPVSPVAPQDTYRLTHAILGEHDLFTVPVGPGPRGMNYEVCISRPVEA